jgi:uncharacterized protein (TIGR04255 family)
VTHKGGPATSFAFAIVQQPTIFTQQMAFEFDLDEKFQHLSKAPIVEAVLQVNARAGSEWTQEMITPLIQREVGADTSLQPEIATHQTINLDAATGTHAIGRSSYWQGIRIGPGERPEIIRFARDFFTYSRLVPYERWAAFLERAMHFLDIHIRVAQPGIAHRIGLRFINRVAMSAGLKLEDYLVSPPTDTSGLELPISGFLYQASFQTPNHPYVINMARTLQQSPDPIVQPPALIVDLDVFTSAPSSLDRRTIEGHLHRMRWLKNKVFFGMMAKKLLRRLQ